MSSETFTTRPIDLRPAPEMAVYQMLEDLHIPYTRMDHPAAHTIEDCIPVRERLGVHVCKNLFLCNTQRTAFYLLMMPGEKPFHTKDLSKQIGSSRLSFALPEHMQEFLHTLPGAVSVMGLLHDTGHRVRLLIDQDLMAHEYFGCHPCVNTASLRLKMSDVMDIFLPATGHQPMFVTL